MWVLLAELVKIADRVQSGAIRRADPEAWCQESVLRDWIFDGRTAGKTFLDDKYHDDPTRPLQAYYWPVMYPNFVERFFII